MPRGNEKQRLCKIEGWKGGGEGGRGGRGGGQIWCIMEDVQVVNGN